VVLVDVKMCWSTLAVEVTRHRIRCGPVGRAIQCFISFFSRTRTSTSTSLR
jgi:hypothetical protein